MATERIQLNLRLDGRPDLMAAIKEAADRQEISVNAWCVRLFEQAVGLRPGGVGAADIEATVERLLEQKLAAALDRQLEERLGKHRQAA